MLQALEKLVVDFHITRTIARKLYQLVTGIQSVLGCDACSVYLVDEENNQLVLMATKGLYQEAVGSARIPINNSLSGLVVNRAEPINQSDSTQHPAYYYVSETGEEALRGYLGVPVIYQRKVLAVLTIQQTIAEKFNGDSETFLSTIASQIADNLAQVRISEDLDELLNSEAPRGAHHPIKGLSGAPGMVTGEAYVVYTTTDLHDIPDKDTDDIEAELNTFDIAIDNVKQDLKLLAEKLTGKVSEDELALFDAYQLMLQSESLIGGTRKRIKKGQWAPGALRNTLEEYISQFDNMDDAYLRERGADLTDLGRRILKYLRQEQLTMRRYTEKLVLVGDALTPAHLSEVPVECLVGMISRHGSRSSHVAIFARAMGIPVVMGAELIPVNRIDGCQLIVDGYKGHVYVSPATEVQDRYTRLIDDEARLTAKLHILADLPAQTEEGEPFTLYVTSGLVANFSPEQSYHADGIGLYRTELPFMQRKRFPGEEEQRQIYRNVLEVCSPQPVYLRTLDIGGDKALSYFPIVEENPFLGWRGIRITLDHPEIFLVQVRAMLLANLGLGNLHIILPMISNVPELTEALSLIHQVYGELLEEGEQVEMPKVGVMIEVPSAVYMAESLARRVDFFSIGSNDLTQYLLAVDRNNARVAKLYDGLNPAVLRAIQNVVISAHSYDKPVGVCGEMAGDPVSALLLVGMGLDNLSMPASSLLRVKWVLKHFTRNRMRQLLDVVMVMEDAREIRQYMNSTLERAGMGVLLGSGSD